MTQSPPSSVSTSESPRDLAGCADAPALMDTFFKPDRADVREQTTVMLANARWLLGRWPIQNLYELVLIEGHTRC